MGHWLFTVWKSCDRYSLSTLHPTIYMDLIICTAVTVGIMHPVLLELASLDKFVLCCSSAVPTGEDSEPFTCLQLGFFLFLCPSPPPHLFNWQLSWLLCHRREYSSVEPRTLQLFLDFIFESLAVVELGCEGEWNYIIAKPKIIGVTFRKIMN